MLVFFRCLFAPSTNRDVTFCSESSSRISNSGYGCHPHRNFRQELKRKGTFCYVPLLLFPSCSCSVWWLSYSCNMPLKRQRLFKEWTLIVRLLIRCKPTPGWLEQQKAELSAGRSAIVVALRLLNESKWGNQRRDLSFTHTSCFQVPRATAHGAYPLFPLLAAAKQKAKEPN